MDHRLKAWNRGRAWEIRAIGKDTTSRLHHCDVNIAKPGFVSLDLKDRYGISAA